ncbi:hypothetical protein [Actinoplanes palleronii]|nr:hypothetical protein [Actinoplanes palleronii]
MADTDLKTLTDRYVSVWNEPDPERRRTAVRELWSSGATHVLNAPQEMRAAAAALGFDRLVLDATGHDALEVRVARAYQEFVAPGTFVFRAVGDADRIRDVVKFRWQMVHRDGGGEPVATGLEVLLLAPDGRISHDYQFIEN